MQNATHGIVATLMELPLFRSEWVLWLLIGLSLVSVAIIVERAVFLARHRVDVMTTRRRLDDLVGRGDVNGAVAYLEGYDALETNVVLSALRHCERGAEAVEDLLTGAMSRERQRYESRLDWLATIGANAPFIGLFGTVLGIIRAFQDLSGNMAEAGNAVMAGISEALIATAVGLIVAIPAVVAFNAFKGRVKVRVADADLLARTLLSHLKSVAPRRAASTEL
jgi:biopolymer transport protein ExbB